MNAAECPCRPIRVSVRHQCAVYLVLAIFTAFALQAFAFVEDQFNPLSAGAVRLEGYLED
jgi:hypothetical protein